MVILSESRTWSIGTTLQTCGDLIDICRQLKNGPKTNTDIYLRHTAKVRDQLLTLAKEIGLIQWETKVCQLTELGERLLRQDETGQNRMLHDSFKENIPHYRYACEYINERQINRFSSSEDFHVHLARQSAEDFGVYIYDEPSYKNVEYVMRSLGVIYKNENDGSILITDDFRVSYQERTFEEHVRRILGPQPRMYTLELCQLLERSLKEVVPGIDEKICYQGLIRLSEKGMVKFESGYPDAPVPAKHALISFQGET